ncbi:hypothetical protein BDN72DRAFT_963999 [Pluteus cervinus]|uniref:Uncharacterized protein n=1 Tax=Pluteus cervinus TaxID=181527 RepID=A0ACD3AD95_9AGAR|nr:hypothetical protein BDN72DRAFT_963999 [Pluteus cervinus]
MSAQTCAPPEVSPRFNSETADVVFLSSDGISFRIHRKNLDSTTGAFPGSEKQTGGGAVPLTETAGTLEILFQFCYPQPQPKLEKMDFKVLSPLADAVERYEVFPAMPACRRIMRMHLSQCPAQVLVYASRHGHKDLADEAAPLITTPLNIMVMVLPPFLVLPWVLYREQWNLVLLTAYAQLGDTLGDHGSDCGSDWILSVTTLMQKLSMPWSSLSDVKEIFSLNLQKVAVGTIWRLST